MISLNNKTLLGSQTHTKELAFTPKSSLFLCTWAFSHLDDVFYFQDVSEDNGISCPIHNRDINSISIASHGFIM